MFFEGKEQYTKGQMLHYLQTNMPQLKILPMYIVNSEKYFRDKDKEINQIFARFSDRELIVRSSSKQEDTDESSNAGRFKSILHVKPDKLSLMSALEEVYDSYLTENAEEILIQPMLQQVQKSGVVFTADMETMADYYIVNYCEGRDTEAITSGKQVETKTFIGYKHTRASIDDKHMHKLLQICNEIECFLQCDTLDIEFAVTDDECIYILQVRPIAKGNKSVYEKIDLQTSLNRIYKKIQKLSMPHPFLLGKTTCFGVMPDWNPAEILGQRPKKLAVSLYKELITDNIWAHQRKNYGYRDLTSHPLMVLLCGVPYIDTRITFNSFIPKCLDGNIAEKLVNYYLDRLSQYPVYHDKIEFEIVYSCYYLGLPQKLKKLLNNGFNDNEIKRIEFSLLNLTNHIIHPDTGLYKNDIKNILILEENYNKIVCSELSLIDKIYWLIEECKNYGTLPFAGVARAGFIAVQFLRSFVEEGFITKHEYDQFMNSLETVNKKMVRDLNSYYEGTISKQKFLDKYGHIRPGTYDITSLRYDEAFDEYFGRNMKRNAAQCDQSEKEFSFGQEIKEKLQLQMSQNGLEVTIDQLILFIKEAIEGREYLKFVFTKSVSKILQLIKELGDRLGIERESLAHLDISVIKQLYSDLYYREINIELCNNIKNNEMQYHYARQLKLPSIIVKPEEVYQFWLLKEEPNYITQKVIRAEIVRFDEMVDKLEGKIVFIQAADPGYDFLFSKKIGGLVTQFGGANSHMAIRCAELGIPAVIGAGEENFKSWQKSAFIELDCMKKQVICFDVMDS